MSGFLGNPANYNQNVNQHWNRNDDAISQRTDYGTRMPWAYIFQGPMFTDADWPRSRFGGSLGVSQAVFDHANQLWEWNVSPTGTHVRKRIAGQTLSSTGAPVGGVTVSLFNTATNLLVDTQVSNAQGYYTLSDPNGVACYVVAYLAGSPDVASVSANTITGV